VRSAHVVLDRSHDGESYLVADVDAGEVDDHAQPVYRRQSEHTMPVEEALLDLLSREVTRQSRYALIAYEDIEYWLHYHPDDPTYAGIDHKAAEDRLWSNVQSFLGAAAMVSNLLWGVGNSQSELRRCLRDRFGVDDDSPLRDRDLRNTFEHFDERLESLFADLPDGELVDTYAGSFMGMGLRNPRSLLRGIVPDPLAGTYQGSRYECERITPELRRLVAPDPENDEGDHGFISKLREHFARLFGFARR
jgi:hypothetical protein